MNAEQRAASENHPGRLAAIAAVQRQLAEMDAADAAVAEGLEVRRTRATSISAVYSIRLDHGELAALERRAQATGLKPTVLARNLIRVGLASGGPADLAEAVERLASAVEELRALVAATPMRAGFD